MSKVEDLIEPTPGEIKNGYNKPELVRYLRAVHTTDLEFTGEVVARTRWRKDLAEHAITQFREKARQSGKALSVQGKKELAALEAALEQAQAKARAAVAAYQSARDF